MYNLLYDHDILENVVKKGGNDLFVTTITFPPLVCYFQYLSCIISTVLLWRFVNAKKKYKENKKWYKKILSGATKSLEIFIIFFRETFLPKPITRRSLCPQPLPLTRVYSIDPRRLQRYKYSDEPFVVTAFTVDKD